MFKSLNLLIEGLVNATVEAVNEAVVMHDTAEKKSTAKIKATNGCWS